MRTTAQRRRGFTLLELLVALVILVSAFTVIWHSFTTTFNAWQRGRALLDEMHNGDFVLEQMLQSLRSAAFFKSAPHLYGFWLDSSSGEYPQDEISWVTSGSAFLPADHPLGNGLYRVALSIEKNDEGDDAVAVRAYPHMVDVEDQDVDPWYISTKVKGIECEVYDFETESWETDWEDTNSVPSLVMLRLYMDPVEQYGKAVIMERLVEIPIGMVATSEVEGVAGPISDQGGTEAQNQQNQQNRPGGGAPSATPPTGGQPAPGANTPPTGGPPS